MALTRDEIKSIKEAADTLNEWRDYVAKTHSDGLGCYISLRHAFETGVDKAVDILLAEKPTLGQDIKRQCDKLLNNAKLVDELSQKNASESRFKEAELLGLARRLILRLQQIAQSAREELSSETPAETGRNTTPDKRWRIWTFVKTIPRWIYYLVGFLAALLTCLYLLWWLWTNFLA